MFFASYINQPESLDIHFLGYLADKQDSERRWVRGITPAHGKLSTHRATEDQRRFSHDPQFPLTLIFNYSNYCYSEPWYYGISHDMVLVLMFWERDKVRFSQFPSGAGAGNPAWDFQWFIPEYKVGQHYQFVMRAMYLPYKSPEQIIDASAHHRAVLNLK